MSVQGHKDPSTKWFFFSGIEMPVGAVLEKNVNFSKPGYERKPKNLYVTSASIFNSHTFNTTIQFLEDNFVQRKKTDKEVWLLGTDVKVEPHQESRLFQSKMIKISLFLFKFSK